MPGSDDSRRWPVSERRGGARRSARERRVPASGTAPVPDGERRTRTRRGTADRRTDEGWEPVPFDDGVLDDESERALHEAAADARARARAPYSGFAVGAALETLAGQVVTGCNIENASYGLTLCAERVALVKALSDGLGPFTRMVVVADTEAPTPPCGPCRQLLWEYCGDIDIILGNLHGPTARHRLSTLLPMPFDARLLNK